MRIELRLSRGVSAQDVIPQLYAYTDCEVPVNSNIVVIKDRKPIQTTVSQLLTWCTEQLQALIKAELEHELAGLIDKQHWLTLEQLFIENRVYKRIEEATSEEAVRKAVYTGMAKFEHLFIRPMNDADVDRLLEIRIKRISQFDIDKNRKDIDDIVRAIKECKAKLKDLVGTTIAWLEWLHGKYGKLFPRRTKVRSMEEIDVKAIAVANIKLGYDAETGFFGSAVKSADREMKVTEYTKIIVIFQDGVYRIMAPPEKTVLQGKIVHLDVFDPEKGFAFTMVYRDKQKIPWAKKVHITSFIHDKEYELIKERAGKIDYLSTAPGGIVTCHMVPQPKQRVHEESFDLAKVEPCGLAARGTRLAERPTAKVVVDRKG